MNNDTTQKRDMKNEQSNAHISKQELGLLSETVSRSIEYARSQGRFTWISLVAGFAFGAFIAVAIMSAVQTDHTVVRQTETLLRISNETQGTIKEMHSELQSVQHRVDVLAETVRTVEAAVDLIGSKSAVPPKTEPTVTAAHDREQKLQAHTADLGRYTVYIHYSGSKNRSTIKALAQFLKEKGYTVPAIEKVTDKRHDIRYFQRKDKEGAQLLNNTVHHYFSTIGKEAIDFDIMDLSRVYPGTSEGVLELWVHLQH